MQSPTQSDTSEKDAPLRYDIRLLGRILGDTIRLHEGEQVFGIIEAMQGIHLCINGIAAGLRNSG
jgi:phosphoenolpyruvate carboxylase